MPRNDFIAVSEDSGGISIDITVQTISETISATITRKLYCIR